MARITTLLVANRGEIARRIFRTCRELGVRTAAVYSEPDRRAPHVLEADVAVPLGGATASESYLDVERVIDAARRVGADAVHPGYGFLSENAAFARAVIEAGLVWVGPTPASIEVMGSKLEAKRVAGRAGVPTLPSVEVAPDDPPESIAAAGADVGLPLLVKASAGGGGKGMRRIDDLAVLPEAVVAAAREAEASFGDGTVFLERLLERPRHVEVQVLGDAHGNVVHLFERDCSIQRRHQKVVEEAPAPDLDDDVRVALHDAAVGLAADIGYVGAGTVEFLVDGGDVFLLEMNTRLQVEHPVTEETCGLDLVALQIRIAEGAELPFAQEHVTAEGHAIEVRLYAEDPAAGFLPTFGVLDEFEPAGTPSVRVDAGVVAGSEISTFYDPMLAKVIAFGADRTEAAMLLARELRAMRVSGVRLNRDFLVATLEHEAFLAADLSTAFLDEHPEVLTAGPGDDLRTLACAAAVAVAQHHRRGDDPHWGFAPSGWRNLRTQRQRTTFAVGDDDVAVEYTIGVDGRLDLAVGGVEHDARIVAVDGSGAQLELDGVHRVALVAWRGDRVSVSTADGQVELVERPRFPSVSAELAGGGPTAPVPGTVLAVEVAAGDAVVDGQTLVVMEAMKMEHRIVAPGDAVVGEVLVAVGDQVDANQVLVHLEVGG
ncbi:MAG: biotin carboxylase N-terminal domain-containing protein [Actinomycetota bacterium]